MQDAAFVSQKLYLWSHRQLWQPLSRNELARRTLGSLGVLISNAAVEIVC